MDVSSVPEVRLREVLTDAVYEVQLHDVHFKLRKVKIRKFNWEEVNSFKIVNLSKLG